MSDKATSAASADQKKRSHGEMESWHENWLVPEGDLTVRRLDEFLSLPEDRQKICWALQTETRVRLNKIKHRDAYNVSTSLGDGGYLIDLYPEMLENPEERPLGEANERPNSDDTQPVLFLKARRDYQRKSRHFLRQSSVPDGSWESLTPISINTRQKRYVTAIKRPTNYEENSNVGDGWELFAAPVPPNFLYFQIILEAYMGYQWFSYCPTNPDLPRSAVMGGAILAALCAWTDRYVIDLFEAANLPQILLEDNALALEVARKDLMESINEYFLYHDAKPEISYPFSDGDTDIFLQASPLTRSLMCHLSAMGLNSLLIGEIGEYLGGLGFIQDDLQRTAEQFRDACIRPERYDDAYETSGCVYALANNGLSCEVAVRREEVEEENLVPWPRTTQLIQLRPQADLLGALMDFDLSCVASAFDGQNVYMTPRAAMSLKTKTVLVTPFLLKEERNSRRVEKYWKRGFDAFLVDPFCAHKQQCEPQSVMFSYEERKEPQFTLAERALSRAARSPLYDPKDMRIPPRQLVKVYNESPGRASRFSPIEKEAIYDYQSEHGGVLCCNETHRNWLTYSFTLFEHTEGDALAYFEKGWTPERAAFVKNLHPYRRLACEHCRYEYEMYHTHSKKLHAGELDSPEREPADNFLHDEVSAHSWRATRSRATDMRFDFYCGASFDSKRAKDMDYSIHKACSNLRSKEVMERVRYIAKHEGSSLGYKPRFVYGTEIDDLFDRATGLLFPAPFKKPVGLNPERFVAECQYCLKWLENCEFSVTTCQECSSKKELVSV